MGSRLPPSTCQNEAATGSIDPTKADIATLREQYKKVISWENKCIWFDKKQPQSTIYLPCHRWQAIVATHKHLLQEHERFFSRSQMPSASAAIRNVPFNYAMFDRMWRYGIYSPLELLHRNLSETLVHMLDFIDYVSSTLNRFLAFDPALGVVLYEQLGDVTRYRMAIERQDRKHWARISRYWYQKAADRNPNIGRIQHSLAVLSHSDVLQKLFYLTKAFVSVQPYPPGHGQATIDIFFDHWKNLPFQHDMAAHFVIVHSALLVNDSGDRFKTSANIFMSLLPRHVQRPRSLNQHEVYIMSCNIASILGYGTPEYQHMADHFSKQNSGAAASESTSVQKKADAIFLTFGTLSVLLRHSKFPSVVPGIHISLAFLWRVSFHRSVMEMLEVAVPWQAVTAFLNSLFSHDTAFSKIEDQNFPVGDYGTAAQLPEDLLIRGQVWSKFYYPESFLKDASGYGISLDELDQEEVVRKNRCLWLGVQIAKLRRWITYSPTRTMRFELARSFAEIYGH